MMRLSKTIVLVMAIAVAGTAAADSSTAKAKQLYDVGLTDYNLGHYEDALVAFEQAYRIRHDAVFLFNIGQCQRQLQRYEDAERSYRAYLRESTDLPEATRDQVQKLVAEMQKAVDEKRAKMPPPGTQPPTEVKAQPATAAPAAPQPSPLVQSTSPPPAKRAVPTYKKPWVWVVVGGVVAAGLGVGLGVGLGSKTVDPSPTMGALVKQ